MGKKSKFSNSLSELEQKIIQELREWNERGRANGHCYIEGRGGNTTKRFLAVQSLVNKKIMVVQGRKGNILAYAFSKGYLQSQTK